MAEGRNSGADAENMLPEQDTFRDTPELRECLKRMDRTDGGYYTVSSLAQLGVVLRRLQEEKARQIDEDKLNDKKRPG